MIIGQNEKLETTLKLLADKDSHVDYDDVLDKIVDRVAVGDIWQMPVESMDDEMEKIKIGNCLQVPQENG